MIDSKLTLQKELLPYFNVSMFLNGIPLIRELVVQNNGDDSYSNLQLRVVSDQPFIQPFDYYFSHIAADSEVKIPLEGLKINRSYLSTLTETDLAVLTFDLLHGGGVLISEQVSVTVYPLEYFGGFSVVPELIAAYVTPNHPYVYHIKRKAVEVLEKSGAKVAFEGYQGNDPQRVLQLISAIYTAIQSEQLVYSALPPGYEETGQRLRLLDTIHREKFANCIDLSLLFAACLEAIDLHPILVLVRGHAFVGCWLIEDKFAETVGDDKAAITKRLSKGIREIAVIEATSVRKGSPLNFTEAMHLAEIQLIEKDEFLLSIDIKRARSSRIRPLPILVDSSGQKLDENALQEAEVLVTQSRFDIGVIYSDELAQEKKTATKQKIWERKLLDLSLRNSLLNIRMSRNMLQLVDIDISHLEDTLSEGKSFSILPTQGAEVQGQYNLYSAPLHHSSPLFQLANDELKFNRLLSYCHQKDLDSILPFIHKNAKQAIEENGSSTLYLAVGLLKWYDRKTPNQARLSPILLIPVELNRRSVSSKFTLKSREEETMVNITLIEFLRQEYELNLSMLDPLPMDEKGVDVSKVMGIFRRAVMQLKGWDVEEQLVLGNFSFSKLILWKDIVAHQDELLKNATVRSLVEGRALQTYDEQEIDLDEINPANLALPIATDASQMQAVLAAQAGKSFILHGPPGTGKSQTITNIIADALFNGKRVLFVAAKKAALDVVHKRLEQIGLASFTLELHSNKSKKSDVLAQLEQALDSPKKIRAQDFGKEAERLSAARGELNGYVRDLHRRQKVGWSLYDSIVALQDVQLGSDARIRIPDSEFDGLDAALWQQWEDWLPQFRAVASLIASPKSNPLRKLNISGFSARLQDQIGMLSEELIRQLQEHEKLTEALVGKLRLPVKTGTEQEWRSFLELVKVVTSMPALPLALTEYLTDRDHKVTFEDWLGHMETRQSLVEDLIKTYQRSIFGEDLARWEIEWKRAGQSWFLPKWLGKSKVKKQLNLHRKLKLSSDAEVIALFDASQRLEQTKRLLSQSRFEDVKKVLGTMYRDEDTDLVAIRKKADAMVALESEMRDFGTKSLRTWIQNWHGEDVRHTDEIVNPIRSQAGRYQDHAKELQNLIQRYQSLTGVSLNNRAEDGHWLIETSASIQEIFDHLSQLKNWINYALVAAKGRNLGLDWLVEAFESGVVPLEGLEKLFYHTVHREVAERAVESSAHLSLFDSKVFSGRIDHYKKVARDFQNLTRQELFCRLSDRAPKVSAEVMQSSEVGILQRAIKNRGRGLSIRKLFDQIPMLLPRIAPCMLMSPISVAQYFDVDEGHFDLVIFDEASQLPTCEAISALARAKQAIVVGDPKQMPPTSFFSSVKVDEENMDIEDLESILDDCLALSIPSKYLLRHYRSKHESLIAFSNANYYENKLLTFPSADDLSRKVLHHPVAGYYDKGKTRQNKFEAEAIVRYVKAHYGNESRKNLSLGVVTFSQTQQSLVEDLIQELFAKHPELELAANECAEPLFVKNLENVQGDERDIILFSVCYAPDQEGKMSMNFGPLNRTGGWRRLNVAVTRARNEMRVFATLVSDKIDLSRTASEGVAGLKAFLHFAERGQLVQSASSIPGLFAQGLSITIAEKLKEAGLEVKNDIGTSGYKVDIGIVHPDQPQRYLLGILIDGKNYWDAKTTNDREMVAPSVLRALGWNIFRVWTLDWLERPEQIIATILAEIDRLKSEDENIEREPEAGPQLDEVEEEKAMDGPSGDTPSSVSYAYSKPYLSKALLMVSGGSAESIYDYPNRQKLKSQIAEVVELEAPISKNLLFRRVVATWNISRIGAKLDVYLEGIIKEMNLPQVIHHQPFYVGTNVEDAKAKISHYRTNEVEKRDMEDIAPEEIGLAILEALHEHLSIEEGELFRYITKVFGFAKVGRQIETLLQYALDLLEKQGRLRREGGRVVVQSILKA